MGIEIRGIAADELSAFQQAMGVPFGLDPTPELKQRLAAVAELDRLRAAFDGDQIVATLGAFSLQLTVPGGRLPTAGTTLVTVLPTHRRQGILRGFMAEHLADAHERKEALAALWASESGIYGRFGYGPASERCGITLDKAFACMREPVAIRGSMRLLDLDQALDVFATVHEQAAVDRPGMIARSANWWRQRSLADMESLRRGATSYRRVLHSRNGKPAGYVVYRTRTDPATHTVGVELVELIGIDADADKALWQFVFGIDLASTITYWNQPLDDPLRWWLEQPRRLERKLGDGLWVRLVDVAAALEGRRYMCAGAVTIRVHDSVCLWNDGTYRLEAASHGVGRCERTSGEADVELTPFALGATYLGGNRISELARAGMINGPPEAIQQLDAMFGWSRAPWCPEVF